MLLALALLLGCAPQLPPAAGPGVSFRVTSLAEGDIGTAEVAPAVGGGWIETVRVWGSQGSAVDVASWIADRGEPCRALRRTEGARVVRWVDVRAEPPGLRWSSRRGIEMSRREIPDPPTVCHLASSFPGRGDWSLSALPWVRLLEGRTAPTDGEIRSLNLETGAVEPLFVEVREAGPDGSRLFVQTASQGWTLRTDGDGRLLAVESPMEGMALRVAGTPPPEAPDRLPDGVGEEDITLRRPDLRLSGTFTRPTCPARPVPVVILVHGSGPIDRDGDAMGLRPHTFRVLARSLAARGFGVIRYDKRGIGDSAMDDPKGSFVLQDLADDVVAWIDAAVARPDVDARRVFLVGHSEGGAIVPFVASRDPRVTGVVLLAGPASRMDSILRQQLRLLYTAHGLPAREVARAARQQEALLEVVASGRDRDLPAQPLGERGDAWLRSHIQHDPGAVLSSLSCPVMALYGAQDLQVPPTEAEVFLRLRPGATHPQDVVEVIPGMDHLLMQVRTRPGMGAYADPDRVMDPRVLEGVAGWLEALRGGP